jgi:hypothetical protein
MIVEPQDVPRRRPGFLRPFSPRPIGVIDNTAELELTGRAR